MIGPTEHLFHLGFRSRPEASGGRWSRRPSTWRLARKLTASPPTGLGISGQLINDREVDKKNFRYEPCFSAYYAFFFTFSLHQDMMPLMRSWPCYLTMQNPFSLAKSLSIESVFLILPRHLIGTQKEQ